jgi:hypothetical protein
MFKHRGCVVGSHDEAVDRIASVLRTGQSGGSFNPSALARLVGFRMTALVGGGNRMLSAANEPGRHKVGATGWR